MRADAWFGANGHERDGMPFELLERDQILATIMPGHGVPAQPGGDEAVEPDESDEEESEAEPT
jgi:hypothetical protein